MSYSPALAHDVRRSRDGDHPEYPASARLHDLQTSTHHNAAGEIAGSEK